MSMIMTLPDIGLPTQEEWDRVLRQRANRIDAELVVNRLLTLLPDDDDEEMKAREARHADSIFGALDEQKDALLDILGVPDGEVGSEYMPPPIVSDRIRLAQQLPSDHLRTAIGEFTDEIVQLGVQLGASTLAQINYSANWRLVNVAARNWAGGYNYELVGGITDTTTARIADIFTRWINAGQPRRDLVKELTAIFPKKRAELIAATEATRTYSMGSYMVYETSGLVVKMGWLTVRDDRVCAICGPLEGMTSLMVRGTNSVGAFGSMLVPCPAHPGCRCRVAPIVDA